MTPTKEDAAPEFPALINALALDRLGYVCTPATTLETALTEKVAVKDESGNPKRNANGEIVTDWQRVKKPAKVAIGSWGAAEAGTAATTERFQKQLRRICKAAGEYGLVQGINNLGVAINTAKSGVTVIDVDAGKVLDPDHPDRMLDPNLAHDRLLLDIFKTAKIPDEERANWLAAFRRLPHVRTPSGGWHYYFRRKQGQRPRMHTGMISFVDIRAGFCNAAGKWESSGLAYAPGNVTLKGEYIAFQPLQNGDLSKLATLPATKDLPGLPIELNVLFEKSTTEIRAIAAALGVAIPKQVRSATNRLTEFNMNLVRKNGAEGMLGSRSGLDWGHLALKFVRTSPSDDGAPV